MLRKMRDPGSFWLLETVQFRPRSRKGLRLGDLRHCVPNRVKPFLQQANAENIDGLTAQSIQTPGVLLRKADVLRDRCSLSKVVPHLVRGYHSAPWLVKSLLPRLRGMM